MPDHAPDTDPTVTLPVWVLGSPSSSGEPAADLIEGLVTVTSDDGDEAVVLFEDEDTARRWNDAYGDGSGDVGPKSVADRELLRLFLQFASEKAKVKNVFIFRRGNRLSTPTIAAVRFNIDTQGH